MIVDKEKTESVAESDNNASEVIARKPIDFKFLETLKGRLPITQKQGVLSLEIAKETEIDGVGMGVLSDGTPFLSGRGLARLCGISNSVIVDIGTEWNEDPPRPRIAAIKSLIASQGDVSDAPYLTDVAQPGAYIYPDTISLAVLEYYAFDAGANTKEKARKNYRTLAGKALREFIYSQVGYDPTNSVPDAWKQFHDRVSRTYDDVPAGYFSVFKEISDMVVTLGQSGLHIDSSFVPDGSVGRIWSAHWQDHSFDDVFGARQKCDHNFPDYFPQAESNPQNIWCYPEMAIGEFRRWMRENYIGDGKFTKYLEGKVRKGELPPSFARLALAAYEGE